ncbi:hypothetical protein B0E45_29835 [Sinorhizobium sp. A49]|uniref:hypothetical protein n=1 Tax=Sinorhizobium sp. A49 TaxID=1945861 RepID=UPI000986F049|nr:hypothetical protein [Sinorhizobium sp. A49]OOG63096.1 hypothetical protein B0E45_29835 [Sinorhizobium sp. A49]
MNNIAEGAHADRLVETIFSSDRYTVRSCRVNDDPLTVVTFAPRSDGTPNLEGSFFGERFFRAHGINVIGVTPSKNDWYQSSGIFTAIGAVRTATKGHRVVGYGGSMGAYGLLNYYHELELDAVIAVAPQFTPDLRKVDFDTRWAEDRKAFEPTIDRVGTIRPIESGYILYDRGYAPDKRHVELIQNRHKLTEIHLPFSRHLPLAFLNQAEIVDHTIPAMVRGTFEKSAFRKLTKVQRRICRPYMDEVSRYLSSRLDRLNASKSTPHDGTEDRRELRIV